jgi:threonine dehydratase
VLVALAALYPPAVDADRLVSLEAMRAARQLIHGAVHRTPMLSSATAARVVEAATGVAVADGRVHLKAEHLQKTGSFKPRGMTARVAGLSVADRERGIITFSAGNAAQGYAYAGAAVGVPVTVVMPAAANPTKVAATRGYGAEAVLEGAHFGEVYAAMERIRAERGLVLCHPFDDPEVIAGHGSVGLEILEDLPDVDLVVCGIGGGGLISGVAGAIREQRPEVRVYGVEPLGSDAMSQALAAGEPVSIQPHSVADGLNAPFAGPHTLAMVQRYLEDVIRLSDEEILSGVRFGMERLKQTLEPAGASALAALLHGRIPVRSGDRVAVVLSGGNLDLAKAGELLAAAAPLPG